MFIWSIKGTVQLFEKAMDINLIDLPYVIYACFVLHNFCEVNKEPINEDAVRMSINYDRPISTTNSG